ncbi:hypothetical protein BR63_10330 [Thermanaerosceptrum fracticalcis]|uniref:FAD-dependent protein C-terminal domain-containing protein n=1 Tax=Thermanaerosceptrum fracticalcis TaxID=1712410 RepID=A0A7G6E3L1_THEFR|nr:hypothetical protein [Thermanaerosceptrum fracticalcis]QNB46665.1 hypothetical protein BR63_10330 [Thermanaerosceptrum fracticalcis]
MIRVAGLKLSLEEGEERLLQLIAKKLHVKTHEIKEWHIYKQSVDARKSKMIYFIYTVDVVVKDEKFLLSKLNDPDISLTPDLAYEEVEAGAEVLKHPPVIIGTGPAGLFAGLLLAQRGYQPLLLERGDEVDKRSDKVRHFWNTGELDPESNVQFGEGGAGTFSDGKLTTLIKDKRCRKVLEELVQAGAPPDILYSFKPHIGTDILRQVVKSLRRRIQELGGQVFFRSKVTDLVLENQELRGLVINDREKLPCQAAILAVGHSARDTFLMLFKRKVQMVPKPFSIGVRIEHPQAMIDKIQYKHFAGHPRLGPADYKLVYHGKNGRSAYTFCMCPGGMVVAAASEPGHVVTNGMSEHARDGKNANSALLVGVTPQDFGDHHPLSGIAFQRRWESQAYQLGGSNYNAPAQLVGDFLQQKPSVCWGAVVPTYRKGVFLTDLRQCLPAYVTATLKEALDSFNQKMPGFAWEEAILTGVETRSSSPVRIVRNDTFQANVTGIYPAGEGAGYAGGIVSAAVDGLRVAEAIIHRYRPLRI